MSAWSDIEREAPELAARALGFLDAHTHKTLATLRRDGSPRISGTEAKVVDGELVFGSMFRAVKALDLLRDPRFALHSGSDDPPGWRGDAKAAGRALEVTDEAERRRLLAAWGDEEAHGESHVFRADVTELVVTSLPDPPEFLVIESWHPGRGVERIERR